MYADTRSFPEVLNDAWEFHPVGKSLCRAKTSRIPLLGCLNNSTGLDIPAVCVVRAQQLIIINGVSPRAGAVCALGACGGGC